jgi:AcrR family transcriptional regulator
MDMGGEGVEALVDDPGAAGAGEPDGSTRPLRADAAANRRRILEAAEEVFAAQGVAAPIDAVAERAGVGIGTVYRHFSTKEDLFEAIVVTRLHELADAAANPEPGDPGEVLFRFLDDFCGQATKKHDLIDALGDAGIEIKSRCSVMSDQLMSGVGLMLRRAQEAGEVRPGLSAEEVLGLVVGVCQAADRSPLDDASRRRMLTVVCDGMRTD